MTVMFTGFALAARIQAQTAREVAALGRSPVCVTLLPAENAPAAAYVARQVAMATEAGVTIRPEDYPTDPAARLAALAADPGVDAVMPLFPLPEGLAPDTAAALIGADKDVDGQHPLNAGRLLLGAGAARPPATARAAMLCAAEILGGLRGANITLVGASRLIGRPLAMLLTDAGATVTLCHADTLDLATHTRPADLIITAAGVAGLIGRSEVAKGGKVLDLAIIRQGCRLTGDADQTALTGHAALISHVPDGAGPVTTACLISNIAAACLSGDRS